MEHWITKSLRYLLTSWATVSFSRRNFSFGSCFGRDPAGIKYRSRNFINVLMSSSVCFRIYCSCYHWSRDGVLCVQTRLRDGKPGALVGIPAETMHSSSLQSACNVSSACLGSYWMGYGGFCWRKSSRILKLSTRLLLVLRLRLSGAIPTVVIWFHGLHNDDFTFRRVGSIAMRKVNFLISWRYVIVRL